MWDWSLHAVLLEKDQPPAKLGGKQTAASGLDPSPHQARAGPALLQR